MHCQLSGLQWDAMLPLLILPCRYGGYVASGLGGAVLSAAADHFLTSHGQQHGHGHDSYPNHGHGHSGCAYAMKNVCI